MLPDINLVCHTIRDRCDDVVKYCPNNGIIVECGCLLGDSSAYIVEHLIQANKTFNYFTIDNFRTEYFYGQHQLGRINELLNTINVSSNSPNFKPAYEYNLEQLQLKQYIINLEIDIFDAIDKFEDESIYCLFIDDNHNGEWVKRELTTWLPKMKKNGIILGDDYYKQEIVSAFNDVFGNIVQLSSKSGNNNGCIVFLKDFYEQTH